MTQDVESIGLLILRIGLGGVFLFFGIDKFFHPLIWINWVPSIIFSAVPIGKTSFIFIVGASEALLGFLVFIGYFARFAAGLSALHLLFILFAVGFNDIMIRDFGLLCLAAGLTSLGPGRYSFDKKIKKDKKVR